MVRRRYLLVLGLVCLAGQSSMLVQAQQRPAGAVAIDSDDIGGVVTSSSGPEAGVWVIAETTDLPTKFAKIVVTDDRGQYLLPDLPKATYRVWVRGYGLVDSAPVASAPGRRLNLRAVTAPDGRAAARVYPANYWYSMLRFPSPAEFPGTGAAGNGIPERFKAQHEWIAQSKGCLNCHQIGNQATREIPKALGAFPSTTAAWDHRVQVGQSGLSMSATASQLGRQRLMTMYADWTDRIAAGQVPVVAPPRPAGVERNLVVTMWDWGASPTEFVHDAIATDKRNPTVNGYGPYYGVGSGSDSFVWIDPLEHKPVSIKMPIKATRMEGPLGAKTQVASPYYGMESYWNNPGYPHNPMMDGKGRIWNTATVRNADEQPAFCGPGSTNAFGRYFPSQVGRKHVTVYDPARQQWDVIDTCFSTHHLVFGYDKDNTLFFSNTGSPGEVVGWINTRIFDETKNAEKAQGWCPAVLDTNGDGKITRGWTEPDEPVDPTRDHRVRVPAYGLAVNPVDGSVWYASTPAITRLELGSNPPETCRAERFEAPPNTAYYPHGIDFDRNGVAWVNFSASGHFARFDRRKCKVLNGPTATGQHCVEGWTFYKLPGPTVTDTSVSADWTYITWVDHFNVVGLGEDVPMTQGINSDTIYALLPATGQWVLLRVPYPLTFYARSHDARIDDPKGGWKGRALWTNYANTHNWHIEGGKGTYSKAVKIQLRPNPLAK
jgi:hypothetical protein